MKYTLYIDYKASVASWKDTNSYKYISMDAKNLEEAIAEADSLWNDSIYLMRIMKKEGKIGRADGAKFETYKAILCRRSYGWHRNTEENSESIHVVNKYWLVDNKAITWYEIA